MCHLSLAGVVFTLGEGALCPISTGSLSEGFPNADCLDLAWLQGTVRRGAHSGLSDCSGYHPVKICVVSEDGNFTTFLGSQKVKKQKG